MFFFFFFQAEDGIRDADVTGVQTCALPISLILDGFEVLDGEPGVGTHSAYPSPVKDRDVSPHMLDPTVGRDGEQNRGVLAHTTGHRCERSLRVGDMLKDLEEQD